LLQEDEGQVEAAGGQKGRSEVCQLILQLSQLQHVLGQGVLQHIHVASLLDKNKLKPTTTFGVVLAELFFFMKKVSNYVCCLTLEFLLRK
jgi:hypothetical protein